MSASPAPLMSHTDGSVPALLFSQTIGLLPGPHGSLTAAAAVDTPAATAVGTIAAAEPRTNASAQRPARDPTMSVRSSSGQDGTRRLPQDHQVHRDRPVVHVSQIEAHGLVPVEVGSSADLPQAGQSRLDVQATVDRVRVARHLSGEGRTRSDQRHVAADHVPQLRQLVDREPSEQVADGRNSRVSTYLEQDARTLALRLELVSSEVRIAEHAAQLPQRERGAVHADPGLSVERAAVAIKLT